MRVFVRWKSSGGMVDGMGGHDVIPSSLFFISLSSFSVFFILICLGY